MNRCPITYEPCGRELYSKSGIKLLSPALKGFGLLGYTAEEQRNEAMIRSSRMSIQGVQPKLSAIINVKKGCFELCDKNGKYILKPQHHIYPGLPENEDLSMRLAASIGIEVPTHGMVYAKDNSLTYFIRRFDRIGRKDKVAVEDFAQLSGLSRDTKYNYSMEKLVKLVEDHCTFPSIEKAKLFKRVVFNYLIGNEDMHLKNYSMIVRNGIAELSPAYDFLNSTIVLTGEIEEIALSVRGKKSNLNAGDLIHYFGKERCGLTDKTIENTLSAISTKMPLWFSLIDISFLSSQMKEEYRLLLQKRLQVMGFD